MGLFDKLFGKKENTQKTSLETPIEEYKKKQEGSVNIGQSIYPIFKRKDDPKINLLKGEQEVIKIDFLDDLYLCFNLDMGSHYEMVQNDILQKTNITFDDLKAAAIRNLINKINTSCKVGVEDLSQNIPEAKLRIVGSGSCEDSLRNLVRELGIEERIIFVGYSNNVNEEYEKADMYIQASSYEGFGMSLLEAGLHGLPILTTNVGLVGYELPQDSVVVFDRNNIEDLSQKISHVLEDTQQRRELGDGVYEASQKLVTSFPDYISMYRSSL